MEIYKSVLYIIITKEGCTQCFKREEDGGNIYWAKASADEYLDLNTSNQLEQEFRKTYALIKHGPISQGPDISLEENLGDEALPLSRGEEDVGC